MSLTIAEMALNVFGSLHNFSKTQVIHSNASYMNPEGKLFQINLREDSPKCEQDWWSLNFLRTYSDCIVTSGKILREEPHSFHQSYITDNGVRFVQTIINFAVWGGNLFWKKEAKAFGYPHKHLLDHLLQCKRRLQRYEVPQDSYVKDSKHWQIHKLPVRTTKHDPRSAQVILLEGNEFGIRGNWQLQPPNFN